MECEKVKRLLPGYLDGAVMTGTWSSDTHVSIGHHLERCDDCRDRDRSAPHEAGTPCSGSRERKQDCGDQKSFVGRARKHGESDHETDACEGRLDEQRFERYTDRTIADRALNRTPLWSAGEHLLYALRRSADRSSSRS